MGLTLEEREVRLEPEPFTELAASVGIATPDEAQDASHYIGLLVDKRNEARKDKDWELADKLRQGLSDLNINLEDTPKGTVWRYKK